jgi:hypothetical protein
MAFQVLARKPIHVPIYLLSELVDHMLVREVDIQSNFVNVQVNLSGEDEARLWRGSFL